MRRLIATALSLSAMFVQAIDIDTPRESSSPDGEGNITIRLYSDNSCDIEGYQAVGDQRRFANCTLRLRGSRIQLRSPDIRDDISYSAVGDAEHDPDTKALIFHGDKVRILRREAVHQG